MAASAFPEVIAAAKWICSLLKNADCCSRNRPPLRLTHINDATAEGKHILASAKQILVNLGQARRERDRRRGYIRHRQDLCPDTVEWGWHHPG